MIAKQIDGGRELRIEVLNNISEVEQHRADWETCVTETRADIYFAPDWLAAWWAAQAKSGDRFRAILMWQAEKLVAALPFALMQLWIGPVRIHLARFAGTDPDYAVLGLPIQPGLTEAAFTTAFAALSDVDAVGLSPLSKLLCERDQIAVAAEAAGFSMIDQDWTRNHTVMRLPDSFDSYLKALSKSRRREYRKDLTALEARFSLENRISTAETATERLNAFIALHTAQWRAVGKAGHFGDCPEAAGFARDAVSRLSSSARARIEDHVGGDVVLSSQFSFRQGDRAYWRLIGRTIDPDLAALGPGRIGMVERIRLLIEEGVRIVEAGSGEYDYKLSYGGELVPLGRMLLAAPGRTLRTRLYWAWIELLDVAYYRLWFKKIAPRLRRLIGTTPPPLWRTWRRHRL